MKSRSILTLLTILFTASLFAQGPSLPVINLQGQAMIKVLPDLAVIDFNIRSKAKLENEALAKLSVSSAQLVEKLVAQGFTKDQIRITNFYLQEDYIYTEGTSRKVGYIASQSLSLRFPYEKEKIAKLIGKLSTERTEDVSLGFSTELSEQLEKTTRNALIEKALTDAREKSEVIARASRLKVLSIQKIDYGSSDSPMYPPMMKQSMREQAMDGSAANFGTINANEITLTERINVTYLVENVK
jgi:uncharacterized protein YggE